MSSPSNTNKSSKKFPFMELPTEIRLMNYPFCLEIETSKKRRHDLPDLVDAVYNKSILYRRNEASVSHLRLNMRIFAEVLVTLHKIPLRITMRATAQGMALDRLELFASIYQRQKGGYIEPDQLVVEIWPPHPDRPIEAYHIWNHLRQFRERLKKRIKAYSVILQFLDNGLFTWAPDGPLYTELVLQSAYDGWPSNCSDIQIMADLFRDMFSVRIVRVAIPRLVPNALPRFSMRGRIFPFQTPPATLERSVELLEGELKYRTACIALDKLRAVAGRDKMKICGRYFDKLTNPWPYFDILESRLEGPQFEGKWHYAMPHIEGHCEYCRERSTFSEHERERPQSRRDKVESNPSAIRSGETEDHALIRMKSRIGVRTGYRSTPQTILDGVAGKVWDS
ncbi:MAG: hypothetical protein Q9218_007947 [Villophora microphyllina]